MGAVLLLGVGCYFLMASAQEKKKLTDEVRLQAPGKFKKLSHGRVHYYLEGNNSGQLVVLIHGGGITGLEVWKKNILFLVNKGYQVLAYDLYGRGYSDRPRIENSPKLFLDQLQELLDSLQLTK